MLSRQKQGTISYLIPSYKILVILLITLVFSRLFQCICASRIRGVFRTELGATRHNSSLYRNNLLENSVNSLRWFCDEVMAWTRLSHYRPIVVDNHRSRADSFHKRQVIQADNIFIGVSLMKLSNKPLTGRWYEMSWLKHFLQDYRYAIMCFTIA